MKKITITRKDDDRSYTDDLITIDNGVASCELSKVGTTNIYLAIAKTIDLAIAKTIEDASHFQDTFKEEGIYDRVIFGPNKITGDRSWCNEEQILVAENKTHFQIAAKLHFGWVLHIFVKAEHDFEIIKDEFQTMKKQKQWGGLVNFCENKIKDHPHISMWYEEIALVYEELKKPKQAKYYRDLKQKNTEG